MRSSIIFLQSLTLLILFNISTAYAEDIDWTVSTEPYTPINIWSLSSGYVFVDVAGDPGFITYTDEGEYTGYHEFTGEFEVDHGFYDPYMDYPAIVLSITDPQQTDVGEVKAYFYDTELHDFTSGGTVIGHCVRATTMVGKYIVFTDSGIGDYPGGYGRGLIAVDRCDLSTIEIHQFPKSPNRIMYSPLTKKLYVLVRVNSEVYVFNASDEDASNWYYEETINLNPDYYPTNIELDYVNNNLFVSYEEKTVEIVYLTGIFRVDCSTHVEELEFDCGRWILGFECNAEEGVLLIAGSRGGAANDGAALIHYDLNSKQATIHEDKPAVFLVTCPVDLSFMAGVFRSPFEYDLTLMVLGADNVVTTMDLDGGYTMICPSDSGNRKVFHGIPQEKLIIRYQM